MKVRNRLPSILCMWHIATGHMVLEVGPFVNSVKNWVTILNSRNQVQIQKCTLLQIDFSLALLA